MSFSSRYLLKHAISNLCKPGRLINLLKDLGEIGPIIKGHFRLKLGSHASEYLDHHAMLMHPHMVSWICNGLANLTKTRPDIVLAVDHGDIKLSDRLAESLMCRDAQYTVLSMYCEPDEQGRPTILQPAFRRLIAGQQVIIIQAVATTGTSGRQAVEAVRALGGIVCDFAIVLNRGRKPGVLVTELDLGDIPTLTSLITRQDLMEQLGGDYFKTYKAPCPQCIQGVPLSKDYGTGPIPDPVHRPDIL